MLSVVTNGDREIVEHLLFCCLLIRLRTGEKNRKVGKGKLIFFVVDAKLCIRLLNLESS